MLNKMYTITAINEYAVRLSFHDTNAIMQCVRCFEKLPYILDVIPAYTTITVIYDVVQLLHKKVHPHEWMTAAILDITNVPLQSIEHTTRIVDIPVCYGGDYGPDLRALAMTHHMTVSEVIERHCKPIYDIPMLGFAPGFPYLRGLDAQLATPRKQTPALRIPQGSVGIAGAQTGIYSIETPGGWHIIGRTPLALFQPEKTPPVLLKAGDRLRFVPISAAQFESWEMK